MSTVYVNGELMAEAQAVLSVGDHGITVGDGLFETMKVVEGTAFAISRHLVRLQRTAAGLGLDPPEGPVLRDAIERTVAANEPGVGRVRITVTGGAGPAGTIRGDGRPSVIVVCSPPADWHESARIVTVPWRRNEHGALTGLKTTSYAENVIALRHAYAHDGDEALFANTAGNVCEGTGTNVFLVRDRIVTPPLSSGCLAGVTRELLLELDLPIDEVDVPLAALDDVTEAFLTSSTRDVQPVASIDGRPLARVGGPLTIAAGKAFRALQARTLDP